MKNIKKENNPNWRGGHYITCSICGTKVWEHPHENKKFCSSKCFGESNSGSQRTEEQKQKISKSLEGRIPWNKGKIGWIKHSEKTKEKLRLSHLGKKNAVWKGDDVKYAGLHMRMRKEILKPNVCTICKENQPYDLSSKGHVYTTNPTDWEWLCRGCHRKKDNDFRRKMRDAEGKRKKSS